MTEEKTAEAWLAQCEGCGVRCVLFEEVEFVCGNCHGEIEPGEQLSAEVLEYIEYLWARLGEDRHAET